MATPHVRRTGRVDAESREVSPSRMTRPFYDRFDVPEKG
jgi:hypothetical protein